MNNRENIVSGIFVIAILVMIGFMIVPQKEPYQKTFTSMDTVITVTLYGKDDKEIESHFEYIQSEYAKYHKLTDRFNTYDDINNVKTINDNAGISPVIVSQELIDIIEYSIYINEMISNNFDISLGTVSNLYVSLYDQDENIPPSQSEVTSALDNTGMEFLEIDKNQNTVYISNSNVELDLGAIAKGYTTEVVAKYLEDQSIDGIINAGGNIRTVGTKPKNQKWNIGITDPREEYPNPYAWVEYKGEMAIVSSGNYERYFTYDNQKYHHIIDPTTGYPSETDFTLITVMTDKSDFADALSTILYIMDYEEGLLLVESLEDTEAIWFYSEDDIRLSSGANVDLCVGEQTSTDKCN